jgi:opacity protein-like surface antigen
MKKILILSLALILGIGATAQVKFGAKAGLNLSSFSNVKYEGNTLEESDGMVAGFHVGGFVNFSFGSVIGLQPEVLFSMQGGKSKSTPAVNYTFDYINVPVLLDIKPFANFSILAGPQIGFNVYKSATATVNGVDVTVKGGDLEGYKSIDFAVVGGLQYTFIEHLTIGARYNIGLTDTFSHENAKGAKAGVLQVSLGWTF